ncbi:DUF4283 domain-containing protein [Raphanus sativus]|nr:DUF4283 domain-containing protein [Raphanus sativus]
MNGLVPLTMTLEVRLPSDEIITMDIDDAYDTNAAGDTLLQQPDEALAEQGNKGRTSGKRVSATLRIQEPSADNCDVNITIPASHKSAGKRRVTSSRKKVPRSPLQSLKLKKAVFSKVKNPVRRRLATDKDHTLPCNKVGSSGIPRNTVMRSQRRNRTEGQDFHPPPPPLP